MTQAARVYGGSLYDLATEEKLDGQIMEQMNEIRQIFRENPEYLKLLGEPAIPQEERINIPAHSRHYWRYRMHLSIEQLLEEGVFNTRLRELIERSGR